MYIVSFYESGNSFNIPTVWPSQLQNFQLPIFVSDFGYQLRTGENIFYNGELTSEIINSDKAGFGIGESQVYMTQHEYNSYLNSNRSEYESWQNSVRNPEVKENTIKRIKNLAQEKIVSPLGFSTSQTTEFLVKQINMNARASEIILGLILGTATSGEQAELMTMKDFFGKVKAIRNHSNTLENYVNSGIDIDILTDWPS